MKNIISLFIFFNLLAISFADTFTFTESTHITENDVTYDGHDIVVQGATLTIDGSHSFNSIHLTQNAVLTHSESTLQKENKLSLTVTGSVTIDTGSKIDVSGKGFPGGVTHSVSGPVEFTQDYNDGGTHAGYSYNINHLPDGWVYSYNKIGEVYGNFQEPYTSGTGGGLANESTNRGGGILKISAADLIINGQILSNGTAVNDGGTGAGGSIWLDVTNISGSGLINANGANQTNYDAQKGAGSGGRIAIYYENNSFWGSPAYNKVLAVGGQKNFYESLQYPQYSAHHIRGGFGTVYLKDKNGKGLISVSGHLNTEYFYLNRQYAYSPQEDPENYKSISTPIWFGDKNTYDDDPIEFECDFEVGAKCFFKVDAEKTRFTSNLDYRGEQVLTEYNATMKLATVPRFDRRGLNYIFKKIEGLTTFSPYVSSNSYSCSLEVGEFSDELTSVSLRRFYSLFDKLPHLTNLQIHNSATLYARKVSADQIGISDYSFLRSYESTFSKIEKLEITVGTLNVGSNGRISATGAGYYPGYGLGNIPNTKLSENEGGAHAALGVIPSGATSQNTTYGIEKYPTDLGGGAWIKPGFDPIRDYDGNLLGAGGGFISIKADSISCTGYIEANGGGYEWALEDGYYYYDYENPPLFGGGAGGSVLIETETINVSGTISAFGGDGLIESSWMGTPATGAGGGGRVAIYYTSGNPVDVARINVGSGGPYYDGIRAGSGTFYQTQGSLGLIVNSVNILGKANRSAEFTIAFSRAIDENTVDLNQFSLEDTNGIPIPLMTLEKLSDSSWKVTSDIIANDGQITFTVKPDVIADADGNKLDHNFNGTGGEAEDIFSRTFDLDLTPPQAPEVTNFASGTVHRPSEAAINLEVTLHENSFLYLNGERISDLTTGQLTVPFNLEEGLNTLTLHTQDIAGNKSDAVELSFRLNTVPPQITGVSPTNGSYTNADPLRVRLSFVEEGNELDLSASVFTLRKDGIPVPGSFSIDGDKITFVPQGDLIDGSYQVAAQLTDLDGLQGNAFGSTFILDRFAPARPVLSYVSQTINPYIDISGSKEAGSAVYFGNTLIVNHNNNITWSYRVNGLTEGVNNFNFFVKDRAGNLSPAGAAVVEYDDTIPGLVDLTLNGAIDGFSASLNWNTYDEVANGDDIDYYEIYRSTSAFTNIVNAVKIGTTDGKAYTATGLQRGIAYHFAVVAVDKRGNNLETVVSKSVTTTDSKPPSEVTNIQVTSGLDFVTLSWQHADSDSDLDKFLVYENGNPTPFEVTKENKTITFNNLQKETVYPFTIKSVDIDANTSTGKAISAYTLLDNPSVITPQVLHGKVRLLWTPAADESLVSHYNLYVSHLNYSSLGTLVPVSSTTSNSAEIIGLTNGVAYYLTVVAVNKSGNEDRENITVITSTPLKDSDGPIISGFKFNGQTVQDSSIVTTNGNLDVIVNDISGVSRVEFSLDGSSPATDAKGTQFSWFWDITKTTDASHNIKVTAYDNFENKTEVTLVLVVDLEAPTVAPVITSPGNNSILTNEIALIQGTGSVNTKVNIYNNGELVASNVTIDSVSKFSSNVKLIEGVNLLSAKLVNRGGEGPVSNSVNVTLDTTQPKAPINLTALAIEEGQIQLNWQNGDTQNVKGFKLYRSKSAFSRTTDAGVSQIGSLISRFNTIDLTDEDTTWYYRISAVNELDTEGPLSAIVSAVADSTPPKAISIVYTPEGPYDAATGRFGAGLVRLKLTVSEKLLSKPFLSLTPEGGVPMTVSLTRESDTVYNGIFTIFSHTVSGNTIAVLSARDEAGNRGNEIELGRNITIDTQGPSVQSLTLSSGSKLIANDPDSPATVTVTAVLDGPTEGDPGFKWIMSKSMAGQESQAVSNLTKVTTTTWTFSLTLPAEAGEVEDDFLRISYSGKDDLENNSTKIIGLSQFLVYQGDLPALDTPLGFSGKSLPGGKVELKWLAVQDAADYAVFRGSTADNLQLITRTDGNTTFTDLPPSDGVYFYAVASVRIEDQEEAISDFSDTLSFVSDRTAPPAPTGLQIELTGRGILLNWIAPENPGEAITYGIFRSAQEIQDVTGLTPVGLGINQTSVIDPKPQAGIGHYTVVAVDAVGNMSEPAQSQYLNFELLPVDTLEISRLGFDPPVLKWTHGGGASIKGYAVTLDGNNADNTGLRTGNSFTDYFYPENKDRLYSVTVVDTSDVESPPRTITLPKMTIELNDGESLRRGIMNQLSYTVTNLSTFDISGAKLQVEVVGKSHLSEAFAVKSGESVEVNVVVGGYTELQASELILNSVIYKPNPGEKVTISKYLSVPVTDASLVAEILNGELVRGIGGQVQFRLHNNSDVEMQIITARSSGQSASNQVRVLLKDADGNVLSSVPLKMATGNGLYSLSNGEVVAVIPAGESLLSDTMDLYVPETAPDVATLQLEIDNFYYNRTRENEVQLQGLKTSREVSLLQTEYYGVVTSITPEVSTGQEPIIIKGQALNRADDQALANTDLQLGISVDGFDRQYTVTTDAEGNFSYTFTPSSGESGVYFVWLRHPDSKDKVLQDSFTIQSVSWSPTIISARLPYDYQASARINVRTGKGTVLNNVRLVPQNALPQGLQINLDQTVTQISGNRSANINFTIQADETVAPVQTVTLDVVSDEKVWGTATLNLSFYTQTVNNVASMTFDKNIIKTGVKYGSIVSEQFTMTSNGLIPVNNINLEIVKADGSALTASDKWVALTSPESISELAVGSSTTVGINFAPSNAVPAGLHEFKVRVTSDNYQQVDFPVFVTVTDSAEGRVLFKVTDMYTNTFDANGNIIEGVEGAEIFMQYTIDPTQSFTVKTDKAGEYLFKNLTVGQWKYRIIKEAHDTYVGTVEVKPGITELEYVGLKDQLISVTWSVVPVTIVDRYDIELNTTFVTNVPAAVVKASPENIYMPPMGKGDVYTGEISYTNLGLIRAEDVSFVIPGDNEYFNFELLNNIPSTIEARETVRLTYRITWLKDLEVDPNGTGGGIESFDDHKFARIEIVKDGDPISVHVDGNCIRTTGWIGTKYRYECPNDVKYTDSIQVKFSTLSKDEDCTISEGGSGPSGGGSNPSGGGSGSSTISVIRDSFNPSSFSSGNYSPAETIDEENDRCVTVKWVDISRPVLMPKILEYVKEDNWSVVRASITPKDEEIEYFIEDWDPVEEGGKKPKLITVQPNQTIQEPYYVNNTEYAVLIVVASENAGRLELHAKSKNGGKGQSLQTKETMNIMIGSCKCLDCEEPNDTTASINVDVTVTLSAGKGNSSLDMNLDTALLENLPINEVVSYNYASPDVERLDFEFGEGDEQVSSIRQIKTKDALMDFVTISDDEYEIRTYDKSKSGPKESGYYKPEGEPKSVTKIQRTSETSISVTNSGEVGNKSFTLSLLDRDKDSWRLVEGATIDGQFVFRRKTESKNYSQNGEFISEHKLYDKDDNVIDKVERVTRIYSFGPALARESYTRGDYTKTNLNEYYNNPDEYNTFGNLRYTLDSLGEFTEYKYDEQGRNYKVISSFEGSTLDQGEENHRVEVYIYDTPESDDFSTQVIYERGVEVSRTYFENESDSQTTIVAAKPGAAKDFEGNLRTVTTVEPQLLADGKPNPFYGMEKSTLRPDGTMTIYSREIDGDLSIITLDSGKPNADKTKITDGIREITVLTGEYIKSIEIYDISSGTLVGIQVHEKDNLNRDTKITYLDGSTVEYEYDCCNLIRMKDRNNVWTDYEYDLFDRLVKTTNSGVTIEKVYDDFDQVIEEKRHGAHDLEEGEEVDVITLRTMEYDAAGNRIEQTDSLGNLTRYKTLVDSDGNRTENTYYPDGSVHTVIFDKNGDKTYESGEGQVDNANVEISFVNDPELGYDVRLMTVIQGSTWTKFYSDFLGRDYKITYSTGGESRSFYNSIGQLIKEVDVDGETTLYGYDDRGQRNTAVDDYNRNGVIDYDGSDRIVQTESEFLTVDNIDVLRQSKWVWDKLGVDEKVLLEVTDTSVDGLKEWFYYPQTDQGLDGAYLVKKTEIIRNETGLIRKIILPDGTYQSMTYENGFYTNKILFNKNDEVLSKQVTEYDNHGRAVKFIELKPTPDEDGETVSKEYAYNSEDYRVSTTTADPDGSGSRTTKTIISELDSMGRVISSTLTDGSKSYNTYYPDGKLKKSWGSQDYAKEFTYENGQIKTLTTWRKHIDEDNDGTPELEEGKAVTTWIYNDLGRINAVVFPDGNATHYDYSPGGKSTKVTFARGVVMTREFDNSGNQKALRFSDGTTPITMEYDRMGRLSRVIDASTGTDAYKEFYYDFGGRFKGLKYFGGRFDGIEMVNNFDDQGRLENFSYAIGSDNITKSYTYDISSRIKTIENSSLSFIYDYTDFNNLVDKITFKNNNEDILSTTNQYDNLGMKVAHSNALLKAGGTRNKSSEYNKLNKRVVAENPDGTKWEYDYDDLGQLSAAVKLDSNGAELQKFDYSFDDIGNRLTASEENSTVHYESNDLNQFTAINNGSQTLSPTYDADGHMLFDGVNNYAWNARGHLTSVTNNTSNIKSEYDYDHLGRRFTKRVYHKSGENWLLQSENFFLYEGTLLVAELNSDLTIKHSYTWGEGHEGGIGSLLSMKNHSTGEVYFYTYDQNGNVTELVSASSGSLVNTYEYDPFGNLSYISETVENPIRFSTKYQDRETGLYYYGMRYYAPGQGRWLKRDPMDVSESINLYGFVNNDPINNIDPNGGYTMAAQNPNTTYHSPHSETAYNTVKRLVKRAGELRAEMERSVKQVGFLVLICEFDRAEQEYNSGIKGRYGTYLSTYKNLILESTRLVKLGGVLSSIASFYGGKEDIADLSSVWMSMSDRFKSLKPSKAYWDDMKAATKKYDAELKDYESYLGTAEKVTKYVETTATIVGIAGGGLTSIAKEIVKQGGKITAKTLLKASIVGGTKFGAQLGASYLAGVGMQKTLESLNLNAKYIKWGTLAMQIFSLGKSVKNLKSIKAQQAAAKAQKKQNSGGGKEVAVNNKNKKDCEDTGGGCFVAGTLIHTIDGLKPIEQIKIGDRVITDAKDVTGDVEEKSYAPAISRIVVMRAEKASGGFIEIHTLLTLEEIEKRGIRKGRECHIQTSEIILTGLANVLEIIPCPEIEEGEGRLVTSLFYHSEKVIYEVKLEDHSEAIGATGNHPFWSETRQRFIAAECLFAGEEVRTFIGIKKISEIKRNKTFEKVFNFEVEGEHVYRVGNVGILVHNVDPNCPEVNNELWKETWKNRRSTKKKTSEGAMHVDSGEIKVTASGQPASKDLNLPPAQQGKPPPGTCGMPRAVQAHVDAGKSSSDQFLVTKGGFVREKDANGKYKWFYKATCDRCEDIFKLNPNLTPSQLPPGVPSNLGPSETHEFTPPADWGD